MFKGIANTLTEILMIETSNGKSQVAIHQDDEPDENIYSSSVKLILNKKQRYKRRVRIRSLVREPSSTAHDEPPPTVTYLGSVSVVSPVSLVLPRIHR